MRRIFIIFLCVITIAYKQNTEQQSDAETTDYSEFKTTDHAQVNITPSDSNQYYLLEGPSAVAVFPDSTWVANEQKKMSEEDWNTIIDDNSYYTSLAIDTLRQSGVSIYMDLTKKRYLVFKGERSSFTLDNEKLGETWSLILFNGTDAPVEWSGTDIYTVLDSIYHK